MSKLQGLAERGREGSRGLQSTEGPVNIITRRVATVEPPVPVDSSAVATRRRMVCLDSVRGLKPTATITQSLRDFSKTEMRPPEATFVDFAVASNVAIG